MKRLIVLVVIVVVLLCWFILSGTSMPRENTDQIKLKNIELKDKIKISDW